MYKNDYSDDFKSVSKPNFQFLAYLPFIVFIAYIAYMFYDACVKSKPGVWSFIIFFFIIWLYSFLRFLFINVKGEFKYNKTMLYYKGYSIEIIPEKIELNISFTDISAAKIYTERRLKSYYKKLIIVKTDGTEIELNICDFPINEIKQVMCQRMLDNPILHLSPTKFKIHINNYKTILFGYLNIDVFINGKQIRTENDNPTINVKTGDLLAIENKNRIQIFRLTDPELTKIEIDDLTDDFIVNISKPSPAPPTSC